MNITVAHNTLTAYPAKGLFGKIFNFISKCQSKTITELYNQGVRGFDFRYRVKKNKHGKIKCIVCHGLANYNIDIYGAFRVLSLLNKDSKEKVYIRLMNEDTFHESNSTDFMEIAYELMFEYNKFKYQVYTSKKTFHIIKDDFTLDQYDCIWHTDRGLFTPKLFAKKFNWLFRRFQSNIKDGMFFYDFL